MPISEAVIWALGIIAALGGFLAILQRRTFLRTSPEGVEALDVLRRTRIAWDRIRLVSFPDAQRSELRFDLMDGETVLMDGSLIVGPDSDAARRALHDSIRSFLSPEQIDI